MEKPMDLECSDSDDEDESKFVMVGNKGTGLPHSKTHQHMFVHLQPTTKGLRNGFFTCFECKMSCQCEPWPAICQDCEDEALEKKKAKVLSKNNVLFCIGIRT